MTGRFSGKVLYHCDRCNADLNTTPDLVTIHHVELQDACPSHWYWTLRCRVCSTLQGVVVSEAVAWQMIDAGCIPAGAP